MKAPQPADSYTGTADDDEACDRLEDCRRQKSIWDLDIREAYFFLDPQRYRSISSRTAPPQASRILDANELQTSLGFEVGQDFATELINAFTPPTAPWAERRKGPFIPDQMWASIKDQVAIGDKQIFEAIKASNFYAAEAQAFMPDAAIGTVAVWIDNLRPAEPVVCQPVPLRELEINIGPTGEVDDRFIVRHTKYRNVKTLLRGITMPADLQKKIDADGKKLCQVIWGFWRDWDDLTTVAWHAVTMVDDRVVSKTVLKGLGSCPLIVGRFNPDPMYAFGRGPGIQMLPELRKIDEVEGLFCEHLDQAIHPSFIYPDDSMLNLENGVEPGMGYPGRMGGNKIEWLYGQGDKEFSYFNKAETERKVKRGFFSDHPEQRGDTPPTATQWLDEMMLAQRRIGTPGMSFWGEFAGGTFSRFQYLLEKAGAVKKVEVDGKSVSLQPYNPAERAADQQKVATAVRLGQIGSSMFPTEFQAGVDGTETIKKLQEALGDELIQFRDPAKVQQLIETFAQSHNRPNPDGSAPPTGGLPQG